MRWKVHQPPGDSCPKPGRIPRGQWSCAFQQIPIPETMDNFGKIVSYPGTSNPGISPVTPLPALQCHLECAPGHVPSLDPTVTCVGGRYEPVKPSQFVCEPAAALLLTDEGEVEVFAGEGKEACNRLYTNYPPYSLSGHSVSLFKNHLVVVGYSNMDESWGYMVLEDPRGSLLTNKWKTITALGNNYPSFHNSFVYGRSLVALGGNQKAQQKLDIEKIMTGNWNSFNIPWKNGTNLTSSMSSSCGVKVSESTYMVFGGIGTDVMSTVLKIDMKQESVEEMPPLKYARAFHACEVVGGRHILVTGGRATPNSMASPVVPDEIYDVDTGASEAAPAQMVTPRFNHKLVLLGTTVYALGGRQAGGEEVATIEVWQPDSKSWRQLHHQLLSHSAGNLAVASLPLSALDCAGVCQCGLERSTRISNGAEVQVRHLCSPTHSGGLLPLDSYAAG